MTAVKGKTMTTTYMTNYLTRYLLRQVGAENMIDAGADKTSGQYWPISRREELELLGRLVIELPTRRHEQVSESEPAKTRRVIPIEARRLPNGDIMVITAESWTRFTNDRDRVAEFNARSKIWGYRYEGKLCDALCELERKGRAPTMIATWFGGTSGLRQTEITRTQKSYTYGGARRTSEEKLSALREYLHHLTETEWPGRDTAVRALELAQDGSIVTIVAQEAQGGADR